MSRFEYSNEELGVLPYNEFLTDNQYASNAAYHANEPDMGERQGAQALINSNLAVAFELAKIAHSLNSFFKSQV